MTKLKGVQKATKKDGSIYYRASITYKNKHISLGSFNDQAQCHEAYLLANKVLKGTLEIIDWSPHYVLTFKKWVILVNFRDSGFYFKTPICLHKNYFTYYLAPDVALFFDVDDLFYYSNHPIHQRGGYYFVNDFGMQVNILSRYGIRNHSVIDRDYSFADGNDRNFRYENITILNPYHGVEKEHLDGRLLYKARIHLRGNYVIGRYRDIHRAAIAYNKAVDYVHRHNISHKAFTKNYIEHLSSNDYQAIYATITIGANIRNLPPFEK